MVDKEFNANRLKNIPLTNKEVKVLTRLFSIAWNKVVRDNYEFKDVLQDWLVDVLIKMRNRKKIKLNKPYNYLAYFYITARNHIINFLIRKNRTYGLNNLGHIDLDK